MRQRIIKQTVLWNNPYNSKITVLRTEISCISRRHWRDKSDILATNTAHSETISGCLNFESSNVYNNKKNVFLRKLKLEKYSNSKHGINISQSHTGT